MPPRRLPDFLIIGAQRCATTALHEVLAAHPRVVTAAEKEVHFFDLQFDAGPQWYANRFGPARRCDLVGESSPYYLFHPLAPARARQLIPEARLIVLLRDPVDRAYSHFNHERRIGAEQLSFEQALDAEDERLATNHSSPMRWKKSQQFNHRHFSYATRGRYVEQLDRWFTLFEPRQILVLLTEELVGEPDLTLNRVGVFLGLDLGSSILPHANRQDYDPMQPAVRRSLASYFAPHNAELDRRHGIRHSWC